MHEPDQHPLGNQGCLDGDHRFEQREVGAFGLRRAGVVAGDRMIGEASQQLDVAGQRGVLEAPDAQVAAGDADEYGAGQHRFPLYRTSGAHHRERARRRNAQRVHRLTDDVFAEHRSHRGQAVATACERGAARPLEMEVPDATVIVDEFAEQQRPPVAQLRNEATELMPGVGLGYWGRTAGYQVAHQKSKSVSATQPGGVEAKLGGQRLVQDEQARVAGASACQGTPISGNSRAKRLCRTTFISGATLTPSRLRTAGR